MKFHTIAQAQEYLYSFRLPGNEQRATKEEFDRVSYLARLLGNPQNKIRVIHVAGTSGKGSTSMMVSRLLRDHGKKVGMSISPHLYDFRERCQINNDLLDEHTFLTHLNEFYPFLEKSKSSKFGHPSFLEIMIVFAFFIFWREKVDYAVMETATGGRVDATNIASRKDKVAIISKIGLDHINILGDTLKKISAEKSAIIHQNNIVVSIHQRPTAQRIIGERAKKMNTVQNIVSLHDTYSHRRAYNDHLRFDFAYKKLALDKIDLSLSGVYQVENASIALAALYEVSVRDGILLDEAQIRETLRTLKNPGRFEEAFINNKRVIIDGAHNPQKMSAFIKSLKKKHAGETIDFILAFKRGKDIKEIVKYILPVARRIYVTNFELTDQAEVMESEDPKVLRKWFRNELGYQNVVSVYGSKHAFERAMKAKKSILVITGSLYLISELYRTIRDMIDPLMDVD